MEHRAGALREGGQTYGEGQKAGRKE